MFTLVHKNEEQPHVNPVRCPIDNLQKIWNSSFVKKNSFSSIQKRAQARAQTPTKLILLEKFRM
jgi:hypothetical protein